MVKNQVYLWSWLLNCVLEGLVREMKRRGRRKVSGGPGGLRHVISETGLAGCVCGWDLGGPRGPISGKQPQQA